MCAKRLAGAQHIGTMVATTPNACSFHEGVLVGGMTYNEVLLPQRDIRLIEQANPIFASAAVPGVAWSFRSLWKPLHTANGMLFRAGESIILEFNGMEEICLVKEFLSIDVDGAFYKLVKVLRYQQIVNDDDTPSRDPYSGGLLVNVSVQDLLIAPVTAVVRKVILHEHAEDRYLGQRTVVDFQREEMPVTHGDIIVPFFPQVSDMVLIKGDVPDPWLAKVLTIQERAKTVRVLYYVEDEDRPGQDLYIPLFNPRLAHDFVSWNSILRLASGEWNGDAWEMELA